MIKRIAVFLFCIIFAFAICVSAQSVEESADTPAPREEIVPTPPAGAEGGARMGRGPGGRAGGMRPPMGENADGTVPQRGMPPQMSAGENPSGADMPLEIPDRAGNSEIQPPQMPMERNRMTEDGSVGEQPGEFGNGGRGGMSDMGDMGGFGGMQEPQSENTVQPTEEAETPVLTEYSTPVISIVLLALAFVFVIFYKRKTY